MTDEEKKKFFRFLLRSFSNDGNAKPGGGAGPGQQDKAADKDFSYNFELLSILEPDGEPTFKIERVFDARRRETITADTLHPSQDPWVWSLFFKTPAGQGEVKITVKLKLKTGEEITEEVVAKVGVPVNQPSSGKVFIPPPRLIKAINTSSVRAARPDEAPAPDTFKEPGAEHVKAILNHLWRRLERGVGPAWVGPHVEKEERRLDGQQEGFGLSPLLDGSEKESLLGLMSEAELEEAWAQTVSEAMTCFPYALPSTVYFKFSDNDYFKKMQDEQDPAYPIVGECQHLCTMAAIWRGFPLAKSSKPSAVTAGTSPGPYRDVGGKWLEDAKFDVKSAGAIAEAIRSGYGPGSVYAYDGKDDKTGKIGPNVGAAHIAFTIRVHPDKDRMQFFDTSGMNGLPDEDSKRPLGGNNRTYEYDWIQFVKGPHAAPSALKFAGIGVLPPPPDLKGAISRLLRSRPLGIVRLALVRRKMTGIKGETIDTEELIRGGKLGQLKEKVKDVNQWLLYATPLLLMYGPSAAQNYSYARYLWALRNHPGREHVMALWLVSVPREELTQAMKDGPRRASLETLIGNAKLKNPKFNTPKRTSPLGKIFTLSNFFSTADGLAAVKGVFSQKAGENVGLPFFNSLPWGVPSGALASAVSPGEVPAYFRGE